jgi:N6-adenosine-specific RNA methylase IME4
MGNYWRVAHEFLLLGVRGNALFLNHSQRSWFRTERLEHSKKPEIVREMIESVSPGPYFELFGRKRAEGWTVWGDEVE